VIPLPGEVRAMWERLGEGASVPLPSEVELKRQCDGLVTCSEAVALAERTLTAAEIESPPRFEAQLLVAQALCSDRSAVVARTAAGPDAHQKDELFRLLSNRVKRVPLAYLRGNQEFYGIRFAVNSATLIPRPETELLVDFAREVLGARPLGDNPIVIDVGCGSGCILIAVLAHCPLARAVAVDISSDALQVARSNAVRLGISDRIRFVQANLLDGVQDGPQLIISNPPYIESGQIDKLQPEVAAYEPRLALDGGADGLLHIREIVKSAARLLASGGWLAVECGQGQAGRVFDLFTEAGLTALRVVSDLAGIQRIVCGMRAFVS